MTPPSRAVGIFAEETAGATSGLRTARTSRPIGKAHGSGSRPNNLPNGADEVACSTLWKPPDRTRSMGCPRMTFKVVQRLGTVEHQKKPTAIPAMDGFGWWMAENSPASTSKTRTPTGRGNKAEVAAQRDPQKLCSKTRFGVGVEDPTERQTQPEPPSLSAAKPVDDPKRQATREADMGPDRYCNKRCGKVLQSACCKGGAASPAPKVRFCHTCPNLTAPPYRGAR